MERLNLNPFDQQTLINAIASKERTAQELAHDWQCTVDELRAFVEEHREAIKAAHRRLTEPEESRPEDVNPTQLDQLWIGKKFERLKRLQEVAEAQYNAIQDGGLSPAELSTAVREFRSYLMLAANELGQLLHRGAGEQADGDTLGVDIQGVDMDSMR